MNSLEKIPPMLICPITQDIMKEPVITCDGYTYDRTAIQDWFEKSGSKISPMTKLPLKSKYLSPNYAIRDVLALYHENKPKLQTFHNEILQMRSRIDEYIRELEEVMSLPRSSMMFSSEPFPSLSSPVPSDSGSFASQTMTDSSTISKRKRRREEEIDSGLLVALCDQKNSLLEDIELKHQSCQSLQQSLLECETQQQTLIENENRLKTIKKIHQSQISQLQMKIAQNEKAISSLRTRYINMTKNVLGQSEECSDSILQSVRETCHQSDMPPLLQEYANTIAQLNENKLALTKGEESGCAVVIELDENTKTFDEVRRKILELKQLLKAALEEKMSMETTRRNFEKEIARLAGVRMVAEEEDEMMATNIIELLDDSTEGDNASKCIPPPAPVLRKVGKLGYGELCHMKQHGLTAEEAKEGGNSAGAMKAAGYKLRELCAVGFTTRQLLSIGFSARAISNAGMSVKELKEKGYNFSADDLHRDGYPIQELYDAGYTYEQMEQAGYTAADLRSVGRTLKDLKKYFSRHHILTAGYTLEQIDACIE